MSFSDLRDIKINYDVKAIQSMLSLLKASPLPGEHPIDSPPWRLGIEYSFLKRLKASFETSWSWDTLQRKISKHNNYLIHYDTDKGDANNYSLDLHFVHVRSSRANAIPLLLLHGWPGTFFDFHKVIDGLVNPSNPDAPAFHVVIPSLPGYFLSTLPRREGWSLKSNARLFNDLMTKALGYKTYVGQGGDWGSSILRIMASLYPGTVALSLFNMFVAPSSPNSDPSKYTDVERRLVARREEFSTSGRGYFFLQNTKPFTIGIAIASSPLAMLAYIGEKIYSWSDPEKLDPRDILDTVALYYLSGSFATSVVIYNQGSIDRDFIQDLLSCGIKNKFGYLAFPFEIVGAPRADIAAFGDLVYYKEHQNGGHFPALDNPEEFINSTREFFGRHWGNE